MWLLSNWQYPCYNPNNGRIKALFKWKNTHNYIFEEQTNNIIPFLSIIGNLLNKRLYFFEFGNIITSLLLLFYLL